MAVKSKVFFLLLMITSVALEGVLASGECSKYEIDGSDAKRSQRLLEAIKKLNEVENVLLGELLTTNSRAPAMNETCGGEGSVSVVLSANGLENSTIVGKNAEYLGNLTNWLQPVEQSGHHWELCWRASRDGWAASTFHSQCDGKGPTVTIVRVAGKYIFGGYISVSWSSTTAYVSDSNAFLFSLVNSIDLAATKLPIYRNTGNAVYRNSGYGPTFGGGHDLHIANSASSTTSSYTNLGHTYETPNGADYASTAAKTFFAGSYNFQPDEVETFYETK